MSYMVEDSEARLQYIAAYEAHYTDKDLPLAFQLYLKVMASYPSDPEAVFSRVQIHNIAAEVISKEELLEAEVKLLADYFDHDALPASEPVQPEPVGGRLPR